MATLHFTQKRDRDHQGRPARPDRGKQAFRAAAAELKAFDLVTGRYDAVAVIDTPNDDVVARLGLATAPTGNARRETARAFTEDEYRTIVASLP